MSNRIDIKGVWKSWKLKQSSSQKNYGLRNEHPAGKQSNDQYSPKCEQPIALYCRQNWQKMVCCAARMYCRIIATFTFDACLLLAQMNEYALRSRSQLLRSSCACSSGHSLTDMVSCVHTHVKCVNGHTNGICRALCFLLLSSFLFLEGCAQLFSQN